MKRISLFLTLLITASLNVFAEDGVTPTSVTFGTINAQTGPSAALGLELNKGSDVYFDKLNKAGGIFGRKIEVKKYDD